MRLGKVQKEDDFSGLIESGRRAEGLKYPVTARTVFGDRKEEPKNADPVLRETGW